MSEHHRCPYCTTGTLHPGPATLEGERAGVALRLTGIPAEVCDTCGEFLIAGDLAVTLGNQIDQLLDAVERHIAPSAARV